MKISLMRRSTSAVALATALMVLAGCTGGTASTDADTPQGGGTLTVGEESQPLSGLDPIMAQAWNAKRMVAQFYEGLLTLGEDSSTIEPGIATEWKELSPTLYEFTLREGVKFHDGTALTPQDVVFSLERIVDPDQHSPYVDLYSFKDVRVSDNGTVLVELDQPQASLLRLLAQPWSAGIVSQKWVEGRTADDLRTQENGTGPYRLVEFQEGSVIRTEAFDEYWQDGVPNIEVINYRVMPEESTRVQALRSGAIDMTHIQTPKNLEVVEAQGVEVGPIHKVGSWWLGLNMAKGPLADERIRQAFSLAIDREQLIEIGAQGLGVLAGPVPPGDPLGTEATVDYPYYVHDRAAAERLLADAGVDRVSLTLALNSEDETLVRTASLIKQQVAKVGIDLEIKQLPFSQLVSNLLSGSWEADMIQLTAALNADASQYLQLWFGEGLPSTKVDDPQLWQMMDGAVHDATSDEDRKERYEAINRYIAERAYMIVPYASAIAVDVWTGRVHGFSADPSSTRLFLKNAWVS